MPTLLVLRQGFRASLLPALNLSQLSEFSLVLLQLGVASGQIGAETKTAASVAFVVLAAISTFAIGRSDSIVRALLVGMKRLGLRDLDGGAGEEEGGGSHHGARIMLLGFFRTASSFVADVEANRPELLEDIAVVDFNPVVFETLQKRGLKVVYGDIAQRDTLVHAGAASAEVLICTVPDFLLKGTTNERLIRQLRAINPSATIVAPADLVTDVEALYQAGADYVLVPRFTESSELSAVIEAIDCGTLPERRAALDERVRDRREILA